MSDKKLTFNEYEKPFFKKTEASLGQTKVSNALERAWKNRDFEIDKYWSRATYFWAFIAATFTGFFVVECSEGLQPDLKIELAFIITCMGIIFSLAWVWVNIGSKKWQENWEKHIDMLEDEITGPLYKTVLNRKSFSVSKINIVVSEFIFAIWCFLGVVQIYESLFSPYATDNPDFILIFTSIITLFFGLRMYLKSKSEKMKIDKNGFSFNRRDKAHWDRTN